MIEEIKNIREYLSILDTQRYIVEFPNDYVYELISKFKEKYNIYHVLKFYVTESCLVNIVQIYISRHSYSTGAVYNYINIFKDKDDYYYYLYMIDDFTEPKYMNLYRCDQFESLLKFLENN